MAIDPKRALFYLDSNGCKHLVTALKTPKDYTPDLAARHVLESPWDVFTPHRLLDQHAHCAFVPTGQARLAYNDGPLSVLNYTLQTIPIVSQEERGRTKYMLKPELCSAWQTLESSLYALISEAQRVWNVNLPIEYDERRDFRPSRYKYAEQDANEHQVRRRANLARACFTIQLAKFCNLYALARMDRRNSFDDMYTKSKINPILLNAVENSWCGDVSIARVGAIIDATGQRNWKH